MRTTRDAYFVCLVDRFFLRTVSIKIGSKRSKNYTNLIAVG